MRLWDIPFPPEIKSKKPIENDSDEVTEIEQETEKNAASSDKQIKCDKCDFIGKTEAGLKTHNAVKHKVSLMKMYRKAQ